ncbi:hypothetical protein [Steroidobacter cummioxidans]|uniref:hypothetical protein n=1 Tax=Steroidobacter cummioxidans TaxID=1803913 RepID=UPI001379EE78|nr:hypothetical protein [Steroidobacter cummioxidans]
MRTLLSISIGSPSLLMFHGVMIHARSQVWRRGWISRMLTVDQAQMNSKTSARGSRCLARLLTFAFASFGFAFSATAVACLCGSADVGFVEEYDEVFSGLVISTQRTDEPVADTASSGEAVVEDPGYWVRSRILVMRTWRGAPSTVAEVWAPVATNCDSPPIPGFYFVALVRSEKGRSVASNSLCDHALKAAATKERGSFAVAGITIAAAGAGAATAALLWFVKIIRRRRPPR